MRERLVVCGIGTGMDRSLADIKALDVELIVVTATVTAAVRQAADMVALANPGDDRAILRALSDVGVHHVDGVLSLGYENPPTVSRLAARFGCPGLSEDVALNCTHKDRRITRLSDAGLDTPRFSVAADHAATIRALSQLRLPAVVKPADQTNSVGVCRVDSIATAAPLVDQAFALSRVGRVVVEEYLEGTEHTASGLVIDGIPYITGFADREYGRKEEFAPYFFEEGDTLPSRLGPQDVSRVEANIRRGLAALGLRDGPFNCDIMLPPDGRVILLEVAARMTGARIATEVMPLATGARLLPNAVRQALGRPLELVDFVPTRARAVVQRYLPASGGVVEWIGDLGAVARDESVYDLFWGMPLAAGATIPRFEKSVDNIAGVIVVGDSLPEVEKIAADTMRSLPLRVRPPDGQWCRSEVSAEGH